MAPFGASFDRVMTNPSWSSLNHLTHVHFGPPGAFTDHSPAAAVPFGFPWCRVGVALNFSTCGHFHDHFLPLVSSHWFSPTIIGGTFISAVMCNHGGLSTSLQQVGDEFVAYYQSLLGTTKFTTPLDSAVISCGPYLPSSSHDFLLSPVSHEDIRKAVFRRSASGYIAEWQVLLLSGSDGLVYIWVCMEKVESCMHFYGFAFKVGPATFPVGAPGPCCCTRLGWTLGLDLCMGGVQLSSSPIGCMPRGRGIVCSVIQLLAAYVDSVHVLSSWLFHSHG
uniref:Uncharacterized protein n=1 Tax=Populus alba TaxID=43335 RepID=A0A4V6A7H1_POPAL|nr:hypothetical protein D5086_0000209850 [Populus alba]